MVVRDRSEGLWHLRDGMLGPASLPTTRTSEASSVGTSKEGRSPFRGREGIQYPCPAPPPPPARPSQRHQAQVDTFKAFFQLAWPRDWFWPMDAEKKRGESLLDQNQALQATRQDGRAVLGLWQSGSLSRSMWGSCLDSCSDSLKSLQEQEASVGLSQ